MVRRILATRRRLLRLPSMVLPLLLLPGLHVLPAVVTCKQAALY